NESEMLQEENRNLNAELKHYHQFHISRSIINSSQTVQPNKRVKSTSKTNTKLPDKGSAYEARAEMKNLLKGQIPDEYQLDYNKLKWLLWCVLDPVSDQIQHVIKLNYIEIKNYEGVEGYDNEDNGSDNERQIDNNLAGMDFLLNSVEMN
ncbi:11016_t:CDS:2, partial [Funneliformis geosporum]